MSDLQNLTPANTYKALLQLGDYTNGISGDTGANALQVSDGAGNNTSLALSTNRVGIGNTSPSAELDVSGDVVADEYALDATGPSSSAVAIHAPASNELAIRTNTAERVRIDSSGNVAIGTTSSSSKLTARISDNTAYANETPDAVDSVVAVVNNPTAEAVNNHSTLHFNLNAVDHNHVASISLVSEFNNLRRGALTFCIDNGTTRPEAMRIDSSGNVLPGTDDAQDFGSSSKRWDDIYATNTTIQSSDRELKQDIEELTEAETRVAQACKGLLRKYRWKDAVAQKGDEARIHFGIIAQDLEDAFTAEGLDAGRYGMFVKNTWWTADRIIPAVEAVEAVEAVYDEEGNEVSPAVEAVEAQPEKTVTDIFKNSEDAPEGATEVTQRGVRYSELLAFIISAI